MPDFEKQTVFELAYVGLWWDDNAVEATAVLTHRSTGFTYSVVVSATTAEELPSAGVYAAADLRILFEAPETGQWLDVCLRNDIGKWSNAIDREVYN